MKQNKQRRMEVMDVTPDMANLWLAKNTKNRPVKEGVIAAYASAMRNGKWTLTPEAVIFSAPFKDPVSLENKPETLIDGQHRLHAIVRSGVTVPMTVWYGCEPEEFAAIGQGRRRTVGDILHLTNVGMTDPFTTSSAISAFFKHVMSYPGSMEAWMAQELLTLYPTDFATAAKYKRKLGKLSTRPVMAALLLSRMVAATKTDDLVEQLQTGIGFKEKDAARLLYRYLHEQRLAMNAAETPETIFYRTCHALSHHLEGKHCLALLQTPAGLTFLRGEARKKLEPVLTFLYGNKPPTTFWEPRISPNRLRELKRTRRSNKEE